MLSFSLPGLTELRVDNVVSASSTASRVHPRPDARGVFCSDGETVDDDANRTSPMCIIKPASSQMEAGVRKGRSSPVSGAEGKGGAERRDLREEKRLLVFSLSDFWEGGGGDVSDGERGNWRRARKTERNIGSAVARLLLRAW